MKQPVVPQMQQPQEPSEGEQYLMAQVEAISGQRNRAETESARLQAQIAMAVKDFKKLEKELAAVKQELATTKQALADATKTPTPAATPATETTPATAAP